MRYIDLAIDENGGGIIAIEYNDDYFIFNRGVGGAGYFNRITKRAFEELYNNPDETLNGYRNDFKEDTEETVECFVGLYEKGIAKGD